VHDPAIGGPACFRCRTRAQVARLEDLEASKRRQAKAGRRPSEVEIERLEAEAEALDDSSPAAVEVANEKHDRRLDDDHEGAPAGSRRIGSF
jgi:hypothetical protein